jgi:hypothetical protein
MRSAHGTSRRCVVTHRLGHVADRNGRVASTMAAKDKFLAARSKSGARGAATKRRREMLGVPHVPRGGDLHSMSAKKSPPGRGAKGWQWHIHGAIIAIGFENIHAKGRLSGAGLSLKAATAAPSRAALSWNRIETKHRLPRSRRLSASDECPQVRNCEGRSPEQLATTTPEDHVAS